MKNLNSILKTIVLLQLIFNVSFAQTPDSKYLIKPMNQYSLSANNEASKADYYQCEKIYSIQQPLNEVWGFYNTVDTKVAWNSTNSKYLMSYDNKLRSYNTVGSTSFDSLKRNKTFLLELTFLKFIKIPVIFEITKIDSVNKIIEFTYMKENRSNGFQTLKFTEKNGITYIKHISYYRSGNKFRDNFIYPIFHKVATDDFHCRIFQLLKNKLEHRRRSSKNTSSIGTNCQ